MGASHAAALNIDRPGESPFGCAVAESTNFILERLIPLVASGERVSAVGGASAIEPHHARWPTATEATRVRRNPPFVRGTQV